MRRHAPPHHSLLRLLLASALPLLGLTFPLTGLTASPAQAADDLASGRPASASSHTDVYPASNVTDGNHATYWESQNNAFPQWVQVDLGSTATVNQLVLKLPSGWPSRTETLSVLGSTNGTSFTTIAGSATYTIAPTATINLTATSARYVRLQITANTGWPAGQISEFEIYGTGGEPPPTGTNLAVGKPIEASSYVHTYVATNANDNNVGTYWEGGAYPNLLTVKLGGNASVTSVALKLNPDPIWGTRTQTIQVLGREQNATGYANLVSSATHTFNPASGNTVTIPVTASVADVQLRITANSGAPGGQVAEFQVFGTPAPNPDLTVTGVTAAPASPVETDAITMSASVRNSGTATAIATNVNLYLGNTKVGTANVPTLAAGASTTVAANVGAQTDGSYPMKGIVDEANTVVELDETNNSFTAASPLVVRPVDSADLVASPVSWSPTNPANGATVNFSVAIKNQGTIASSTASHGITLTVANEAGIVVRTLTGSVSGAIAAGATSAPVNVGTWTAANGRYTVKVVIADDANELPVKRPNNTSTHQLFVGRGANMPYDMYEAEDGVLGGGAARVGPNRDIGNLAGEASGRRAVTLNSNGSSVEFTTRADTNTLVTRFSMPDSSGGGGITSSLNIYVDGVFHKAIPLTSKYAWLYGAEASPGNSPGGPPRHIYDEANVMLNSTVPAGHRIKLQKDPGNDSTYAIDFVNFELATPAANPDPARYAVPTGFSQQDVQNALDVARQDANLLGVYLPAGNYATTSKFNVYGKAVRIVGAGPWYTRFNSPQGQENSDVGWTVQSSANGSTFQGFSHFGNWASRIDGPGKIFDLGRLSNITIDNLWVEHQICMFWGMNMDHTTIKNTRIRNTFADGLNFTNGSVSNLVSNVEARSTGDDAFALFAAIDGVNADQHGNTFENITSLLTWRAAGVAIYGGYDNVVRNAYIADTLTYPGITISSLDFGIPMKDFGPGTTRFENISLVRDGGHFWGNQTFPAMWIFSASKVFTGIRVSDVDIVDPTYSGIMFQTKYTGTSPEHPVQDTIFTNVRISGAQKSGDAFDAKSGFGIWVNELPEPGQGPAVGSATFNNLTFANNYQNIKNTTSTFTLNIN